MTDVPAGTPPVLPVPPAHRGAADAAALVILVRLALADLPTAPVGAALATPDVGDTGRLVVRVDLSASDPAIRARQLAALTRLVPSWGWDAAAPHTAIIPVPGWHPDPPLIPWDRAALLAVEDGMTLVRQLDAMGLWMADDGSRPALAVPHDRCLVLDGSQLSPSWRALPGGAEVHDAEHWSHGRPRAIEAYDQQLDVMTDLLGLSWEDGCLWLDAPADDDDDDDADDPFGIDLRRVAGDWHGGQGSALYAFASSGTVVPGITGEIRRCLRDQSGNPDARRELEALLHYVDPLEDEAVAATEATEATEGLFGAGDPVDDLTERGQFIAYLTGTLIPDLRGAGSHATADDFETCVRYMRDPEAGR